MSVTVSPFPRLRGQLERLNDFARVYVTDVTGTEITLPVAPVPAPMLAFKNGTLLDDVKASPDYTVSGRTITLGTAAVASDVFQFWLYFREGE